MYDMAAAILFAHPDTQPGRITDKIISEALKAEGKSIGPLTIAAIRANMSVIRPRGRRQRDPDAARVMRAYRLHPSTSALLVAEAARTGSSQAQVIDRLATDHLPPA